MQENQTDIVKTHANIVKYQVISVDKIVTPKGMPGSDWYCYVIGHGNSKIDGKKPGTLENVTQHAEAIAEDLNLRSQNKKSVYAPKQNQNKINKQPPKIPESAESAESTESTESTESPKNPV